MRIGPKPPYFDDSKPSSPSSPSGELVLKALNGLLKGELDVCRSNLAALQNSNQFSQESRAKIDEILSMLEGKPSGEKWAAALNDLFAYLKNIPKSDLLKLSGYFPELGMITQFAVIMLYASPDSGTSDVTAKILSMAQLFPIPGLNDETRRQLNEAIKLLKENNIPAAIAILKEI